MRKINYLEAQDKLMCYLNLQRYPVGVQFLWTKEEVEKAKGKIRSHKTSYCNSINFATKGESVLMIDNSHGCSGAMKALKIMEDDEDSKSGKRRFENGSFASVEVSKSISDNMVYLKNKPQGILAQPLGKFVEDPHMVLIIAKPYPMMRIIQGYSHFHGMIDNFSLSGMQALCQEMTSFVYEKDQINLSMLCPGTRMIAGWSEEEQGMGIPIKFLEDIVNGIQATINPFERNPQKRRIRKCLEEKGLEASFIKENENYDTGSYMGGKVEGSN